MATFFLVEPLDSLWRLPRCVNRMYQTSPRLKRLPSVLTTAPLDAVSRVLSAARSVRSGLRPLFVSVKPRLASSAHDLRDHDALSVRDLVKARVQVPRERNRRD